jgi:N-acetylmuramoyl-L-alanine amidase
MNRSGQDGNGDDAANTLLAYFIHKGVLAQTAAADRGVKRAGFQVLREAPCPAVLVECGFISNRREEEKLMQSLYRDSLAEGIAQGILTYVGSCGQGKNGGVAAK